MEMLVCSPSAPLISVEILISFTLSLERNLSLTISATSTAREIALPLALSTTFFCAAVELRDYGENVIHHRFASHENCVILCHLRSQFLSSVSELINVLIDRSTSES